MIVVPCVSSAIDFIMVVVSSMLTGLFGWSSLLPCLARLTAFSFPEILQCEGTPWRTAETFQLTLISLID